MTLQVLGPVRFNVNGETGLFTLQRGRTRVVLAGLVVLRRQATPRTELARLLWPDVSEADGLARLRRALYEIRNALRQSGVAESVLRLDGALVMFDQHAAATDVGRFEQLLEVIAQHSHNSAAQCRSCRPKLLAAAELYRGALLSDYAGGAGAEFEQELIAQRLRLERDMLSILTQLMRGAVAEGDWETAAERAGRMLEIDPFQESAFRTRLEAFARSGQRATAAAEFRRFRRSLRSELGGEPELSTVTLAAQIQAGQIGADTAGPPAAALIGRERLLGRLEQAILAGRQRLTSIVGVGGSGKTSLATALLERVRTQFSGGGRLIRLSELNSLDEVWQAVLRSHGIEPQQSAASLTQLARLLDSEATLLVFDNAEHLPELAAPIGQLLRATSRLTVVVTSRVPLGTADEWVTSLDGLEQPAAGWDGSGEWPAAVRLFVREGQHHKQLGRPTLQELRLIGDLTRAMCGLPLGLLLAAAQLRTRSLAAVHHALVITRHLPTAQMDGLDERHRSLERVIDSMWLTMTDHERNLLMQVAVFVAEFDLAAVHAVVDWPAGRELELREQLYSLVDRTLLRLQPSQRFAWHPLLHDAARRRLAGHADARIVARRHATLQLQRLAEQQAGATHNLPAPAELRAAWMFFCEQRAIDELLERRRALADVLFHSMQYTTAAELLEAAAAAVTAAQPTAALQMRCEAVVLWHYAARYERTAELLRELAPALAASDDAVSHVLAAQAQIMRANHLGHFTAAYQLAVTARQRWAAQVPAETAGRLLHLTIQTLYLLGDFPAIIALSSDEFATVNREHRPARALSSVIVAAAHLHAANEITAAARVLRTTLHTDLRAHGQPHWIVAALDDILAGRAARAELDPIVEQERPISSNESGSALVLAMIQRRMGALQAAQATLEQALATSRTLRSAWGRGAVLVLLSHNARQLGDTARARTAAQSAVELCEIHCDLRMIAHACCALGYAWLGDDDTAAAAAITRAAELRQAMQLENLEIESAVALAQIDLRRGERERARERLTRTVWNPLTWWVSDIAAEAVGLLVRLSTELALPEAAERQQAWLAELDRAGSALSAQQRADWDRLPAHRAVRDLPAAALTMGD